MQERALFTILPAYTGWQLFDGLKINDWFNYKMTALAAANAMAKSRHYTTGQPTGVKVQMQCGDWIMVHCHD